MGYRISSYYVSGPVDPNVQVELGPLKLCKDPRSVLHGTVIDCDGNAVANAVVKIFSYISGDPCACTAVLTDLGHVFTDPCGQFMFIVCQDPGAPTLNYLIKIFKNNTELQSITPPRCITEEECCDPSCEDLLG